jgi:hypothetical protein
VYFPIRAPPSAGVYQPVCVSKSEECPSHGGCIAQKIEGASKVILKNLIFYLHAHCRKTHPSSCKRGNLMVGGMVGKLPLTKRHG